MKKKSAGTILALFVMLCMLLTGGVLTAQAVDPDDTKGSINITVAPWVEGTEIRLFNVGNFENGTFTLNDSFTPSGVVISGLKEASQAQEAAEKLTAYAVDNQKAFSSVLLDAEGTGKFDSLEANGTLYLLTQAPDSFTDIVKISPMLVVLPYQNTEDESVVHAKLAAKYEDLRKEPEEGAVILSKVSPDGDVLEGAEFRFEFKKYDTLGLLKEGDEGVFKDDNGLYYWEVVYEKLTTNVYGQLSVEHLPFGVYRFVETKAPQGFEIKNPITEVVVNQKGTVTHDNEVSERYVPAEGYAKLLTVENAPVQISHPESSEPESSQPQPSKPSQPSDNTKTGDSAGKYIVVGVVVGVSLVAVILLIVLGKKGKNNKDDDDDE